MSYSTSIAHPSPSRAVQPLHGTPSHLRFSSVSVPEGPAGPILHAGGRGFESHRLHPFTRTFTSQWCHGELSEARHPTSAAARRHAARRSSPAVANMRLRGRAIAVRANSAEAASLCGIAGRLLAARGRAATLWALSPQYLPYNSAPRSISTHYPHGNKPLACSHERAG